MIDNCRLMIHSMNRFFDSIINLQLSIINPSEATPALPR